MVVAGDRIAVSRTTVVIAAGRLTPLLCKSLGIHGFGMLCMDVGRIPMASGEQSPCGEYECEDCLRLEGEVLSNIRYDPCTLGLRKTRVARGSKASTQEPS